MKKTNIAVLIVLVMIICAMAVFTACETTQEENSPVEYTVTFDSNGGSAVKAQTVEQGKKVVLPAEPTKDNCDFVGWYTEDNKPYDFDSAVNANFTLYAKWQEIKPAVTYTVTFDANGGSAVKSQEVEEGGKATVPEEPYYEGYDFIGWYTDEDTLYDFDTEVRANLTLTAKWSSKVTVEEIKYNDLNEFFSNLSETELDNFKTSLAEKISDSALTPKMLVGLFGSGTSIDEVKVLKIAFNYGEEDKISKIEVLLEKTTDTNKDISTLEMNLSSSFGIEDLKKANYKGNGIKEILDENNELIGISFVKEGETVTLTNENCFLQKNNDGSYTVIDYTTMNASVVSSENKNYVKTGHKFTIAKTQEQIDLFNLLMPYAVSESTQYSHITVSYRSGTDSEYGTCFGINVIVFNENTNCYEYWNFKTDDSQASGKTAYERIVEAVNKGYIKFGQAENKQMISGDIILNLENEDEYITINPIQ